MAPTMEPPTLRLMLVCTHEWRAAFRWHASLQLKPTWSATQPHIASCYLTPSPLHMVIIEGCT